MTAPTTPAVFIHGLWLHATSWQPWMDLFRESGYDPIAPGWPGEAATVTESRKPPAWSLTWGSARSPTTTPRSSEDCPLRR
ncbi:MAG TPA: hypothetical protein VIU11_15610 [Nakamurella sp.]